MNPPPLNFWKRFTAIWQPDFIERLKVEKSPGKSWGFWFLSNLFIAIIITAGLGMIGHNYITGFPENVMEKIEGTTVMTEDGREIGVAEMIRNFEVEIVGGDLVTRNLPDPAIIGFGEDIENPQIQTTAEGLQWAEFVILLDSRGKKFDEKIADTFPSGFFVFGDQIIVKDGTEYNKLPFSDIDTHVVLNYQVIKDGAEAIKGSVAFIALIILFFGLYFTLVITRLISALWWGLVFWGVGAIAKIDNWNFEDSFFAVLHFKLITLIISGVFLITNVAFPMPVTLMLGLLFGMNFWHMKQSK